MWALWHLRNKRRHGKPAIMSMHQAITWTRDTAFDLWNLSKPVQNTAGAREAPRWKAPESSFLKINTDAAYCAETGKGATACVIRGHRGATVMAQAKWYDS
jgi:hypothetical protein